MPVVPLFDHLIGACEERRRNRQPKRLRSLDVDDQLERGGLRDGQISRLRSFEDPIYEVWGSPVHIVQTRAIGHDETSVHPLGPRHIAGKRLFAASSATVAR